jgi:hypothetical protein
MIGANYSGAPTAAGGPTIATAGTWQQLLAQVGQLGVDVARHRLIDVERVSDDNNVPDQADLRYGLATPGVGGMTLGGTLLVVGVVVAAAWALTRLIK